MKYKNNHYAIVKGMAWLFLIIMLAGCTGLPLAPMARADLTSSSEDHLPAESTNTKWLQLNLQRRYIVGVNYPWLKYGHDFGTSDWGHDGVSAPQNKRTVEADFTVLHNEGVNVVRWFLFADGRVSPEFDAMGNVYGLDNFFYDDLDTALELAQKHSISLILVLFDFYMADKAKDVGGLQAGGHAQMITDPKKQQTFLDHALKPLLQKYGNHPNILAWEVMNEPEGAMNIWGGRWVGDSVSAYAMQAFVTRVVRYIHTYSTQYATVGSASRRWLGFWTGSHLDFYQYHYYDAMESQYPFDYSFSNLKLDRPCIVGEFPTKNTNRALSAYLDTIWNGGYAGALAWSYRAEDDASEFNSVAGEFKTWSEAHQVDIQTSPSK